MLFRSDSVEQTEKKVLFEEPSADNIAGGNVNQREIPAISASVEIILPTMSTCIRFYINFFNAAFNIASVSICPISPIFFTASAASEFE